MGGDSGGSGWQLGCVGGRSVSGVRCCMRRHLATAASPRTSSLRSVTLSFYFLIFLFHSFPLLTTIVLHSPLCVVAPSSSKLTGGRKRECKGGRAVQVRGTHHGSDRVSAPSKAFHHIFVVVCTPALQSEHSKLLLMLCGLLCVLLQRALLLLLAKLF